LLLGAALGLGTRFVYHGPSELLWLHKVGVPWLAAAFVVGALRPGWRAGAVHGALALVTAVIVYYEAPVAGAGSHIGLGWIWIAIPGGAVFGALGAAWRSHERWRLPAAALLAGAFLGEAMIWYGRERPLVALAEYCAAAVVLGVLLPRNSQRVAAAVAAGVIAVAAAATEVAVYVGLGYLVG
jgi:hypothetical protein